MTIQGEMDDPVLAKEGTEGNVLPLLDVAGGPIVEENQSEDVVLGFGRRDALAKRFAVECDERHFEFEIEQARWSEDGGASGRDGFGPWDT